MILRRNRGRECQDDSWYDLDYHSPFRHSRHFSRGNDCQGGFAIVVPKKNCPIQKRQRSKLSSQVKKGDFQAQRNLPTHNSQLISVGEMAWHFVLLFIVTDQIFWIILSFPR